MSQFVPNTPPNLRIEGGDHSFQLPSYNNHHHYPIKQHLQQHVPLSISQNNISISPPNNNNFNNNFQQQPYSIPFSSCKSNLKIEVPTTRNDSVFTSPSHSKKYSPYQIPTLSISSPKHSYELSNANAPSSPIGSSDELDIPISTCIPLLQLKHLKNSQRQSPPSPIDSPNSSTSSVPCINTQSLSNCSSANNSPRSYYVPDSTALGDHRPSTPISSSPPTPCTPTSSSSSTLSSPRSTSSSPRNNQSSKSSTSPASFTNNRIEEQWKKLEYYTNDFNHFIFESLKNKEFNQISILNQKMNEVVNSVKEIEITNSIVKTLPPQTRARKKRSTKAEKLHKETIGFKRTYVTTPKSKGNYCYFCGTMETPEWRKGPGGHKTLCNACGLHYAKNIKKETINPTNNNNTPVTSSSSIQELDPPSTTIMSVSNLIE
eukprot:gene2130-2625_t